MKTLFAFALLLALALPAGAFWQPGHGLGARFHPFAGLRHHRHRGHSQACSAQHAPARPVSSCPDGVCPIPQRKAT